MVRMVATEEAAADMEEGAKRADMDDKMTMAMAEVVAKDMAEAVGTEEILRSTALVADQAITTTTREVNVHLTTVVKEAGTRVEEGVDTDNSQVAMVEAARAVATTRMKPFPMRRDILAAATPTKDRCSARLCLSWARTNTRFAMKASMNSRWSARISNCMEAAAEEVSHTMQIA